MGEDAIDQSVFLILHHFREGKARPLLYIVGQVVIQPCERLLAVKARQMAIPILQIVYLEQICVQFLNLALLSILVADENVVPLHDVLTGVHYSFLLHQKHISVHSVPVVSVGSHEAQQYFFLGERFLVGEEVVLAVPMLVELRCILLEASLNFEILLFRI